jgi:GR25 family glycosyltransferase involved in LPS biosynthesis
MKSLNFSYDVKIRKAYIIRIKGHELSESLARRCADSVIRVNMQYEMWDAFDGIKDEITPPENMHPMMKMIKLTDHFLTRAEIACALSHISLWVKCVEDDQPLVILEHDAVMVQHYPEHSMFNSIDYLGSVEQMRKKWSIHPTPPHGTDGENFHFICRAHAYSIDPAVAKNMLAYVLQYGINTSLDRMLRADIFPIHQMGLYAYDEKSQTTIANRASGHRPSMRNDTLEN